ncbi:MAG: hypothetical protein Q8N88_04915 [Nanoarchaeota archaeon]|nr:hypothetical protein [Nanoarchaeota archaeon]
MGKEKHKKKVEELFSKSPVVNLDSIKRIIKDNKDTEYQKQLIRNLKLHGKIRRLAKGYYTIHENPELNVFCFQPAYLGLQDAFSVNNLWEQETIPIIITSKKIRIGIRRTELGNILIRRINRKYIFGYEYKKIGDFYFPYSDVEKTFIDMLYFRQKIDSKVIKETKKLINKKKFSDYLKKYPSRFQKRVLKKINDENIF